MATPRRPRTIISAVILSSFAMLATMPVVDAAKIPERGYVPAGIASVIHVRVDAGCAGAPTDTVEVRLPASLELVTPQAIMGWTVETETVTLAPASGSDEAREQVRLIRWSGGSLPDGQFMDFAFRAQTPADPGRVLEFPVVQYCGSIEKVYSGRDGDRPAPFVRLGEPVTPADLAGLVGSMDALLADVESIREQIASVRSPELRERVIGIEESGEALAERVGNLRERIRSLEDLVDSGLGASID